MNRLKIPTYGKINLTLDVLGKRLDGYHDVEMIMQTIDLHDQVILTEEAKPGIRIRCNHPYVPEDESNLAYRAADLLMQKLDLKDRGIQIEIRKNIPVAAGLAGGSTNAAGVLVGLNELWRLKQSDEELMDLGSQLGADVPFCILGGTALAQGTGIDLTPVEPVPEMELILVKPDISVSTKEIYTNYKAEMVKRRPDTEKMLDAIRRQDRKIIKENLANVLEDITLHYYPLVAKTKEVMQSVGINPVLMSGSGPTLFAIVDKATKADELAKVLKTKEIGRVVRTKTR